MTDNKTQPTQQSVAAFIAKIENPVRRADAMALDVLFRQITGWEPRMWGPTLIGYGSYHYTYDSGRSGDMLATGFSPRKAHLVLYVMPGYQDYSGNLASLGKHKMGKSCLYINKLADVDIDVVAEILRTGLDDLGEIWPVTPS